MDHSEWIATTTHSDSVRGIARTSRLAPRSVQNWMDRKSFPAEAVIAIAMAYGSHPVGALVETGYLDPQFAREVDPVTALREVSEDQLADEVLRRMKLGLGGELFDTPIDELPQRHLAVADTSPAENDHPEYDESSWDA